MSVTLTVFFDEPFWAELFERRDEGKVRACKVMVLDARYHNAWIAHLLERDGIQRVTGYRRHTYKGEHYGKYRFRYDPKSDEYIYPEKQRPPGRPRRAKGTGNIAAKPRRARGVQGEGNALGRV